MERPSSIAIPITAPADESSTSDNIHLVHKCCDSQCCRLDINSFADDLMKPKYQFTSECLINMTSVSTDDVTFNQPDKGSTSKSTKLLVENANSLSNLDCHEIAAMFVEQILNNALDSIFRKKDSTQYSKKECMKLDTGTCNCISNAERIETCLKSPNESLLCSVYPEGGGLVSSSSLNSLSPDYNYHLVPEQMPGELQSNNVERNFSKTASIKETNLVNLEKFNVSNSSVSNKANESMVFFVNSSSEKCERKPKLDFSVLRDILLGEDYFPPYLPNDTELQHIVSEDNRETATTLPKCYERAASNMLLLTKSPVNNTFCQTLKRVKNTILGQSIAALTSEKTNSHFAKELCGISPGTSCCNVQQITAHLEFANSVTNDFDNIIQCKTNSLVNIIETNKLTSTVKSVPVKVQMNNSNLISTFVSGSSRTVSQLGDKLATLPYNFTQNDQTVPIEINKVVQNVFETSGDGPVKTVTEMTNSQRNMSVPLKSYELNQTRTSDHNESLCNDYSTNDCDEMISLELLQMFTVTRTKTVIEQNFEFCNINNLVPCNLHVNEINNVVNHQGIGNSTSTAVIQTLEPVPRSCSPILKNSSMKVQSIIDVLNKEALKPTNFDYNDLFEISNSSWSDVDLIKEGIVVAEKALDKIVEDRVLVNLPLLNEEGDNFAVDSDTSDNDELDRVIDDSIKKYEHFTADASILATPTTSEKSCQTEMIEFQNIVRCKRCLEFVDQTIEPMKKKKCDSLEESYFEFPTTSAGHIDVNDSPAQSTLYINIHNASKILPGSKETVQFGHTSSPERFPKCGSLIIDEAHELDDEDSLFDAEDNEEQKQMDWSIESSYDSEQEVPINLHANEDMDGDDEATDSSSENEYFEALEGLTNARKL